MIEIHRKRNIVVDENFRIVFKDKIMINRLDVAMDHHNLIREHIFLNLSQNEHFCIDFSSILVLERFPVLTDFVSLFIYFEGIIVAA